MAFQAGAITTVLGLDAAAFNNPLTGAIELLTRFGASLWDITDRLAGMAEGVAFLAEKTGLSTTTIQGLRQIMEDAGRGAAVADDAIAKMNLRLGDAAKDGGATVETLKQLGLNIADVGRGEEAFRKILDQLAAIKDPAIQAAAGAEIFGKAAGDQLITAIGGGTAALDEQIRAYEQLGVVVSGRNIENLAAIDDVFDQVGNAITGLQNTFVLEFFEAIGVNAGSAGEMAEYFGNAVRDITPYVESLAGGIGALVELFVLLRDLLKDSWVEKLIEISMIPANVLGWVVEKGAGLALSGDSLSADQLAQPGFQAIPATGRAGR